EALRIARQIASGLAEAHEFGIVHRDIKPGNVIVGNDGVARIIGFGLARLRDAPGIEHETPLYLSPEQASGALVDARTDVWSLGAVLFEMLTGRQAVVHDVPPKLRKVRHDLPAEIERIVSRALETDLTKRYQTASEMLHDLSIALAGFDASARKPAGLRAAYTVPALVLLLLAAVISIWFYRRSEELHWAREGAIPEIARLTHEDRPVAAFLVVQKAQRYLPGDPQLAQLAEGLTHAVSIRSWPSGASV